ncbi:MAG: hypothetical protein H0V96_08740 [Acidimicrobiia bacterium]|nr:hypothetical protein [Acidimicrobiia bacterium]
MPGRRHLLLATGVALVSVAAFLALRLGAAGEPADPADPPTTTFPTAAAAPLAAAAPSTTVTPDIGTSGAIERVLASTGNTEIVAADGIDDLPESVTRVLIDRRAVLTVAEEAP